MAEPAINESDQEDMVSSGGAVALRYAAALLDLACENGTFEQVGADMADLANMIAKSEALHGIVTSPAHARHTRSAAMREVIRQAGLSPLIDNLVQILIRNSRLCLLEAVIRAFGRLVAQKRGEMRAEVISAHPLGPAQRSALEAVLARMAGGAVILHARVDKNLLGGLIVRLGSRMIDDSLRNKLTRLKLKMKEA